ncbi:heat-shock protein HslJ [Vibrio sp. UCD-FRSSP16_10]|uniref:META domain-containing protein n=1 Tax=unclassified Vibrio TaxID=2614977 RepID=UPI0007FF817C|nr:MULTISPECIES: META domain-containing protein [unclassified Vibrio]OBT13468.1 heat-shock protein HslJ [Vibrio sp. UCD-FRSSP16_10]OBT17977.1 heat-shock protein HslJ [Vibrio sp. UCD-FRSSP16_30]
MYKKSGIISLVLLLSACSTTQQTPSNQTDSSATAVSKVVSSESLTVNDKALQHHHWILSDIDGEPIASDPHFKAPTLEIGENMTANGLAGCNNFFGQGELNNGKFRIQQMGMTMKMCPDAIMKTEMLYSQALAQWNQVTLTQSQLVLKGPEHTLTFKLKDWVN